MPIWLVAIGIFLLIAFVLAILEGLLLAALSKLFRIQPKQETKNYTALGSAFFIAPWIIGPTIFTAYLFTAKFPVGPNNPLGLIPHDVVHRAIGIMYLGSSVLSFVLTLLMISRNDPRNRFFLGDEAQKAKSIRALFRANVANLIFAAFLLGFLFWK